MVAEKEGEHLPDNKGFKEVAQDQGIFPLEESSTRAMDLDL